MNKKKTLIIFFALLFLPAIGLLLYISFADLDYGIIQRYGFYPDTIARYLSGEKVVLSDDFTVTGTLVSVNGRTLELDSGVSKYFLFIDDNTYVAIDGTYEGKGKLPIGGYVGHGRETVLNALRINSTITIWGDFNGANEVKVRILHLIKQ